MHKNLLVSLLAVFAIASYENTYAHGAGGGDRSYKFDKSDNTVDQETRNKVAAEQKAREHWDGFMKAIKDQEKETDANKKSGNNYSSQ